MLAARQDASPEMLQLLSQLRHKCAIGYVRPPLIRLIAEEMNSRILHPLLSILLGLDMLQAKRLIPPLGKDVKGDLPADRIRQAVVGELLFQRGDEGLADGVRSVVRFVGGAFGVRGVAADGRDVDHAVSVCPSVLRRRVYKPFLEIGFHAPVSPLWAFCIK